MEQDIRRINELVAEKGTFVEPLLSEVRKVIVGQRYLLDRLLIGVLTQGHLLLEGVPGLAKTLSVKSFADAIDAKFQRIQFTPDMLPADLIGTMIFNPRDGAFSPRKGPLFAHLILADEINRAPAKVQSALLEAMQERQVTLGGRTFPLPEPFTLVATQNSLDTEGVFPLGEAQVDRFLVMIEQDYPTAAEEKQMLALTTGTLAVTPERVAGPETVLAMQRLAREVPVVPSVRDLALWIVRSSRPGEREAAPEVVGAVRLGASPRAAQALLLMGKVLALARGRLHVAQRDVLDVVEPVMAHRVLLDFRARAEGATHAEILKALVERAQALSLPAVSRWTRELLRTPEGENG